MIFSGGHATLNAIKWESITVSMVILIHWNNIRKKCPGYKMDIGHWIPSNMQEIKTWWRVVITWLKTRPRKPRDPREEYYMICTIVEMSVWYAVDKWSIVATKEAIVWLTKHSWNKKEYPGGPVSLPDTRLAHPTGKVMTCSNEYHYIAFKHGQDCAWSLCGTPEALRHEYAG